MNMNEEKLNKVCEIADQTLEQVVGGADNSSKTCTIINCDAVNIRNATSGGDVIGSIPRGKKATFIKKVGNWGLVEYRGIRGYIWYEYYRLN